MPSGEQAKPTREEPRPRLKVAASEMTEMVDRLPIEREVGKSPRVVLALGSEGGQEENRLPTLEPGDHLRAMSEVAVTTDDARREYAVAKPYSYDPVVAGLLLLTRDPKAPKPGRSAIELARGRLVCTQKQHHAVLKLEGDYEIPERGLPWDGPAHLTVVLGAAHSKATPGHILLVGQNEPDGSIGQDMARINAARFRGVRAEDGEAARANDRRFGALPLETELRDVYALRLDKARAGEQFLARVVLPTDSRHLKHPARISTRIILTDDRDGLDESDYAAQVATFKGRVGRNNGFNSLGGRDRTERKAVFRITRDCDRPLFLKLVATAGPAGYPHRSGEAMKVEDGGGLEIRRFAPEYFG